MEDSKILEQQITSAPEEIRKFIAEEKWVSVVEDIAKKDGLSLDQKTSLENEVLFALIGLDLLSNLEKNLSTSLGIDPVLAKAVTMELNERIFKEMMAFLPTEIDVSSVEQEKIQPVIEKPDLESLPPTKTTELEVPPANLPMIEASETVHDTKPFVPPIQQKPTQTPPVQAPIQTPAQKQQPEPYTPPTPQAGYPGGKDPYREPLE